MKRQVLYFGFLPLLLLSSGCELMIVNPYPSTSGSAQHLSGPATRLVWATQPSLISTPGTALSTQPVAQVEDAYGNVVAATENPVAIQLFTDSGCTLAAAPSVVNTLQSTSNGVATFSGYTINTTGTFFYQATTTGLTPTPCSSTPITVNVTSGTTYYVDNCVTVGNDANSGTSATSAWLTINHVNSQAFNPGDSILFRSTCTWHEQLTTPTSGIAGKPITFGAYGAGAQPMIDGLDVVNPASWVSETETGTTLSAGFNLDGWWQFLAAGSLGTDSSGSANTLTVNGAISQATGPNTWVPEAALLTATSSQSFSRLDASLSAGFPGQSSSSGSVTVGLWVKPGNQTATREVLNKGCAYAISILSSASSELALFEVYDNAFAYHEVQSTISIPSGTWSHIVGVWNSATGAMTIYVNGVNVSSAAATSATMAPDANPFQLGAPSGCFNNSYYDGTVAQPVAFATALTAPQIQSLYYFGVPGNSFGTYYSPLAAAPNQVLEDGIRLTAVTVKDALTPGTFFYDIGASRIYVRTRADDNPSGHTMEVGARAHTIFVNGVLYGGAGPSYLTFSGLNLHGASGSSLFMWGNETGVTVNNCTIEWSYAAGFIYDDGTFPGTLTGLSIENSVIRYNGGSGIEISVPSYTGLNINNNQIYSNAQLTVDGAGAAFNDTEEQYWSGGIHLLSTIQTGGAGSLISNNTVYNNGVPGVTFLEGAGIWVDTNTGVTVQGNLAYGNNMAGIFLEKDINCVAVYNLLYNNGQYYATAPTPTDPQAFGSIYVAAGQGYNSTGNLIANNTVYGGWWGIGVGNEISSADAALTNNNIIRNNIIVGATDHNLFAFQGGDNDGVQGSGNIFDHNAFGTDSSATLAYWETVGALTTYASLDVAYGSAMNNIIGDPKFTNVGGDVFTLLASSPALNAGVNLGTSYQSGLLSSSTWPSGVVYLNQNVYGSPWTLGAFVH